MALGTLIPELYCSDYHKSLDFYTRLLGFSILFERSEQLFVMLDREGARLMLEGLATDERKWLTGALHYPFGRGLSFQIAVSNVDVLYEVVIKENWPVFLPLEEKWYRNNDLLQGNRQFIIQDPDGFLLRFAQDLGTKPV